MLNSGMEEAPVRRADAGLLAGVILTGGMLGPFLMLWGLERLSGVLTSLLLNLEAPFTVLIAILVFREHLVRLELAGVLVIVVGAGILTYRPGAIRGDVFGILAVLGACLCWAIDNNLSQRLSLRDPLVVTRMKTLGAGLGMLGLATLSRPAVAIAHNSAGDPSSGTRQLWGEFGAGHARAPAARRGA